MSGGVLEIQDGDLVLIGVPIAETVVAQDLVKLLSDLFPAARFYVFPEADNLTVYVLRCSKLAAHEQRPVKP